MDIAFSPTHVDPPPGADATRALGDRAASDPTELSPTPRVDLNPHEAFALIAQGTGVLVDVRTAEERKVKGKAPDSLHAPWRLGPAMTPNPRFLREFASRVPADKIALLICAAGRRSQEAAAAARAAGFVNARNVLEGFDGAEAGPGWIARGLPYGA
jgi:rhodanese-related sulfurtransferase